MHTVLKIYKIKKKKLWGWQLLVDGSPKAAGINLQESADKAVIDAAEVAASLTALRFMPAELKLPGAGGTLQVQRNFTIWVKE